MFRLLSALRLTARLAAAAVRSRLTGQPYLLNIHLSWKCNSKCRHCFIWKVDDHSDELNLEDYRGMFRRVGKAVSIVSFSGGQPTLKEDLAGIMLAAIELLPRLALLHYTTNSLTPAADLALIDAVLSVHPRFPLRVSLSLDGLAHEHDSARGVSGNFEKVAGLFASLRKRERTFPGLAVGFSTTMASFNIDRLRPIRDSFPGKDFHTFDFYHQNDVYYGDTPREDMALDREGRRRASAVVLEAGPQGIDGILNRVFLSLSGDSSHQPACAAGRASLSVFPKGEVKRCFFLEPAVGDLRRDGLDLLGIAKKSRTELGVECRKCWNTCNAYATMAARPLATVSGFLRSYGGE